MPVNDCGSKRTDPDGVLARYLHMIINSNGTYEIYQALSAADARSFLEKRAVHQSDNHVVVQTPEGIWGKDSDGMYLEALLPMQLNLTETECIGTIAEIPSTLCLEMASRGHADNFLADVACGICGSSWTDGIRYRNKTAVRCPGCGSLNLVDSGNIIFFSSRL